MIKKKKTALENCNLVKEVFENESLVSKIHLLQTEKVLSCAARSSLQLQVYSLNKPRVSALGIWCIHRALVGTSPSERSQSCHDGYADILSIFRTSVRCLSRRKNDLKISSRDMSYLTYFFYFLARKTEKEIAPQENYNKHQRNTDGVLQSEGEAETGVSANQASLERKQIVVEIACRFPGRFMLHALYRFVFITESCRDPTVEQ